MAVVVVRGWSALGQREAASAQLQVWSRPPGAGAGHHWYLYTAAPPPVIWPPDHSTLCAHNPAVLFIRSQKEIEVVQHIFSSSIASGAGTQETAGRRLLASMVRRAPIKG